MRIFHTAVVVMAIAILQVTTLVQSPVTAQLKPLTAEAAGTTSSALSVNFASEQPISVVSTQGSFDQAVVAPLRAAQAAKAEAEAKSKQKTVVKVVTQKQAAIRVATGDIWEKLRLCEAGGDYAKNTGNGYYGAYQYNIGTWANYGGYARPDLAPPAVQDAKAKATQAARGWGPWPACARKLGLI